MRLNKKAAAALALFPPAAAYTAYIKAFRSPKRGQNNICALPDGEQYEACREKLLSLIDEADAIPFEQVYITSYDGLRLAARYYHVRDGAPVEIEFHGYRSTAMRDFCGGVKLSRSLGYNVLLVDQRAHGKSGGHTITFGVKERFDCLEWINYVNQRFGPQVKIILSGISMGAATVLMAAGLPLPENVAGVMADCPYTSPREIICKVIAGVGLSPALVYPYMRLGARMFGGFDPDGAEALSALRKCNIPVLLIHGEADLYVPCEMSRRLREACASPARLLTVPGAGHGLSYIVDPEAYELAVREFLASL